MTCPSIPITVGGIKTQALIDTGSHVTYLSQDFYQNNIQIFKGFPKLPVSNLQVHGFTGEKSVRIKIQIRAPIKIDGRRIDINFLVIPRFIRPCILGIDTQKEL